MPIASHHGDQLIIITGTPCSGKTFRAQQILQDFQSRIEPSSPRSVVYLPSHHASLDPSSQDDQQYTPPDQVRNPRDVIYDSARLEKTARAEEFSAIKRAISKNTVVIADAPNYIKGFRYQLFCEAKAAGTRSVVVHTAAREDECVDWNNARLQAWGRPILNDEHTDCSALASGPKIGRDVLGNLEPESHTAIYGDKVLDESAGGRSRSSSVGGVISDEDQEERLKQKCRRDETMTLKSLYISDKPDDISTREATPLTDLQEQQPTQDSTSRRTLPPSTPPTPKSSLPYSSSSLRSLFMRYEPPSPFTRWDTPLFTIPSTDSHPPYDQIWEALFPAPAKNASKKALMRERHEQERIQKEQAVEAQIPPQQDGTNERNKKVVEAVRQNAATVLPAASAPDALQTLESTTGEITKLVLAVARDAGVADTGEYATLQTSLLVDGAQLMLEIEKPEGVTLSQPKLQRLRRKYTQIQRGGIAHGKGFTAGRKDVAVGFAKFLEDEWVGEVGE
ncbi:kti12, chromatin associated [Lithohypha guttulata]|uniref:Kti12, chromatin associated n=1 Tax=Lithohypha guttulata TaxID=1690604 RepID=A0AAN7T163_9EURO|nr:kti12, chromatin associated [Lithohypha guttulata]